MKITGRSTINTVLKDPEASEWLKGALRLALELKCGPGDVLKNAHTVALLMMKYIPVMRGLSPRRQWPGKIEREDGDQNDK